LTPQGDKQGVDQARNASIVIFVAIGGWMLASYLGGLMGLPIKYAFLIDFAALAAMVWSMVVLFKVWRARQEDKGPD
jgi:hypothetical protein